MSTVVIKWHTLPPPSDDYVINGQPHIAVQTHHGITKFIASEYLTNVNFCELLYCKIYIIFFDGRDLWYRKLFFGYISSIFGLGHHLQSTILLKTVIMKSFILSVVSSIFEHCVKKKLKFVSQVSTFLTDFMDSSPYNYLKIQFI